MTPLEKALSITMDMVDRAEIEAMVQKHRERQEAADASPMTAPVARAADDYVHGLDMMIPSNPPEQLDWKYSASHQMPEQQAQWLAETQRQFEPAWQEFTEAWLKVKRTIPTRTITNNISVYVDRNGSPVEQTYRDCRKLIERIGMDPGSKKGPAANLAWHIIKAAFPNREPPSLAGIASTVR